MLKDAGVIGHQVQVFQVRLGQLRGARREGLDLEDVPPSGGALGVSPLEALDVPPGYGRPDHVASVGRRPFAKPRALRVVAQECIDLARVAS